MKPLVLLDVDGVLNDLNRWSLRPWAYTDHLANRYTIRVPEYMPEFMAQLLEVADIIWCTTWAHDANYWIAPLVGLPPLEHVRLEYGYSVANTKLPGARRVAGPYLNAGVPVVWIEDFDAIVDEPFITVDTTLDLVLTPEVFKDQVLPALT